MYDQVADLSVTIQRCEFERLERATSSGFDRATTVIRLSGAGETGSGEDVTYTTAAHDALQDSDTLHGADSPLAGQYTVDSFSAALFEADLWPESPDEERFRHYRRWGFESAALDLALKQTDTDLGTALGRQYDPVNFVVSTRLSDPDDETPPTADRLARLCDSYGDLSFKLDPTPSWSEALVGDLTDYDVRVLDLKGLYEGTDVDVETDPEFYRRVVDGLPDALVEDPDLTEATRSIFDGREARVTWDVPITGVESIEALPFEPAWLNMKPSRCGTVESVLATIDYCEEHDIDLYGGGQFELGVGRDHIQALASLCYPDGPNDVAPGGYNDPDPDADLPTSPLTPPDAPAGIGAGFW
jgi:L-alanine-DL-glutamate epimerase-like enolase superfamily enzyme